MNSIYEDGTYLQQNPTWHAEHAPWKAHQILTLLQRHHLTPATVGEIGCGAGEILRQLSLHLPGTTTFAGYEISPQAFALCQARNSANVHFHQEDLLCEQRCFELVLAIDVMEHVADYLGFLEKLKARGQYKIFHIPLEIALPAVLCGTTFLRARRAYGHLHHFTQETALAALTETGYQIRDACCTLRPADWRTRGFLALPPALLRKALFAASPLWTSRLLGGTSLLVLAE